MSVTTKLISTVDIILNYINKDLYKNIEDYCFLESATGDNIFSGEDGSLATMISLDGIKKIVENEEINDIVDLLYKKLKTSFKTEGHSLQVFFTKDPARTKDTLTELVKPFAQEGKNMQMDVGFLFEGKVDHLQKLTCFEENILVIWSRPTLIEDTIKKESEDISNELKKYPIFEKGQNLLQNYKVLKDKHEAFISNLMVTLVNAGFSAKTLHVLKQSNKIKQAISSELTHENWEARTPLAKKPVLRDNVDDIGIKESDISYLMYPSLKKQFIPDTFERLDSKTLKVGEKYVASMYIDIPQDEPTPFFDFIKTVDSDVPFQISFKVNGGGLNNIGLKKFLATILAWSPGSNNNIIKEALEYYQQEELSGKAITKNCITINTWAYDEDELSRRKSFLFKSLQGWGSMTPYFSDDDNYEAFFATIPSYTPKMYGNNFIDSFDNILFMLPLTRQANIWEQGCIINRTPDGKIMPYQVASTLQASWNELIFAKPGSGKSVWSNYSNWSFILTPKTDGLTKGKLPFVGIIDIGPSSLGLIKLLQMFLPESRHHEVIYKRLSNSKDDAINMFDTQDGCRQPNDKEREFIVNFITLLLTPAGGETPSSIDAMVNNIVTELYKEYSDEKNPKAYEEMEDAEVDEKLKELNIKPENRSWWWVTDQLFENNENRLSKMAQKRAVPVLEDCVKIANSVENIKSTYSKPKVQATRENMLDYFNRTISETINNYPLLNTHTHLDLSDARVISLDLNDVAKGGDAAARKKSSVMFMLARFVVTRNFFLEDNTFKFAPKLYKEFLINKTKESRATQKRLCIDELHRTSGIQIFREQIKQDMREGRKWGLSICLISQLLNDFDSEMIDLCNSKFIFSGGDNYQDIVNKFDLNGEVGAIVRTELNGPTHLGVPFVVKFTTKSGEYTQFLYNALSPIEMWAFSSTLADVKMRELAEISFGIKEGIKILAESFPNGSISGTIEKMQRSDKYARVDDPIGYLMDKLKKKHVDKVRI